eukprot:1725133-Karenia_brevis.AAC.1
MAATAQHHESLCENLVPECLGDAVPQFDESKRYREDLSDELRNLAGHPLLHPAAAAEPHVKDYFGEDDAEYDPYHPRYGQHRHKITRRIFPLDCMVAKPVSKREILADTTGKAEAARQKEWNNLRKK